MNTISQLFNGLLGLGVEPKELTFLQISLRGDNRVRRDSRDGAREQ
jgi:hypothetical protein